jgi:uncharacterized protein YjbJ (UPF0337 family)
MNKDELKGKVKQVKGAVKQEIGARTGDPALADQGTSDRSAGKMQERFGRGKRKVGEAIEDIGRKVKR